MTPEDIAEDIEQSELEPLADLVAGIPKILAAVFLGLALGGFLAGCAPQSYRAVTKQAPPAPYMDTQARGLEGFPYLRAWPE